MKLQSATGRLPAVLFAFSASLLSLILFQELLQPEYVMDSVSAELVRNSSRLQSELLRKAVRLVKQGGIIVYSTCSVLPEENERVILPFLKKGTLSVVACAEPDLSGHLLPCEVPGAFLVCPDAEYEGFFAVCLKKN